MTQLINLAPPQVVRDYIQARGEDIATTKLRVWWNEGIFLDVPALGVVKELESTLKGHYQLVRLNEETVVIIVTEDDMLLSGRNQDLIDRFFERLNMICHKYTYH